MAKEFAFLFYTNDWAGGTQWMSRLQRGGYLDLLLYQVNNTSFSLDEIRKVLGSDFDEVWPGIKDKFFEENGLFFNQKMRKVLEERKNFSESRRANRLGKTKDSKNKKQVKNTSKTKVKLVGDEKEKEDVIEVGIVLPFGSNFANQWELWKDYKLSEHKFRYKTLASQQAAISELVQLSGGVEETAIAIIHKSMSNGWKGFFAIKDHSGKADNLQSIKQKNLAKLHGN